MNAEIISIGSELLLGQIVDTNASWIAHYYHYHYNYPYYHKYH